MNFTEWLIEEELFESFDLDQAAGLIQAARHGNREAESKFIRLISPMIERRVDRLMMSHNLSPDVYNDALLAVVNQFIRSQKPYDIQFLPHTINSIIRNKAIDAFRKTGGEDRQGNKRAREIGMSNWGGTLGKPLRQMRNRAKSDEPISDLRKLDQLAYHSHRGDANIGAEFNQELRRAMDDLDSDDQQILKRYFFDREGSRDIAGSIINQKTGRPFSPNAIHERIDRIKKMIYARLVNKGFDTSDLDNLGSTYSHVKQSNSEPLKISRGMQGNRKMSVPGDI